MSIGFLTKEIIKSAFRKMGLEVSVGARSMSEYFVLPRLISRHRIAQVIDVGANTGQYGHALRALGYVGLIASIEPLPSAYATLQASARSDPLWEILPRCAVGASDGSLSINVSENSVSSSFLPLLPVHTQSAPHSAYVESETVPVRRLDALLTEGAFREDVSTLLKLDTQGFEGEAIAGASKLLERTTIVQCELSLVGLYAGQPLMEAIIATLRTHSFIPVAFSPGFKNSETSELLQCDGFFRNTRLS